MSESTAVSFATETPRHRTARILYTRAMQADSRYSEVIRSRCGSQVSRWDLTAEQSRIPEIADAFREKCNAFDAWETFNRLNS